ncbi:MAG: serpin family protein, partial [Planctomycetota bacterium]
MSRALLAALAIAMSTLAPAAGARQAMQDRSADLTSLVRGNTCFAIDLYHRVRTGSGNTLVAPQSISTALAMTYVGARTETASQMATTMHFELPQEQLHPAFAELQGRVAATGEVVVANRLFGLEGEPFQPDFIVTVGAHYGGGLETVDFAADAEGARRRINSWVGEQTNGRIPELFTPDQIGPATVLALVNAVHFAGRWKLQFDPARTQPADFFVSPERTVRVAMMHVAGSFEHHADREATLVRMPFDGDRLEMVMVVPTERHGLAALEAGLTSERLDGWLQATRPRTVDLHMPKFSTGSRYELSNDLASMGMPLAFTAAADFSGMTSRGCFISVVAHETFIEIDEQGAEAAAATGVVMSRGAPPSVRIDQPFLYMIRDRETGSILFLGRLAEPAPIELRSNDAAGPRASVDP